MDANKEYHACADRECLAGNPLFTEQTKSHPAKEGGMCGDSFQLAVVRIGDWLAPFSAALLAGDLQRKMREPAIRRGTVPVFDLGGDIDNGAGGQLNGILAPFLIVSPAADTDEHLTASASGVVDVPVVAAGRLEGHIVDRHLLCGNRRKVALPHEELPVGIFSPMGKKMVFW